MEFERVFGRDKLFECFEILITNWGFMFLVSKWTYHDLQSLYNTPPKYPKHPTLKQRFQTSQTSPKFLELSSGSKSTTRSCSRKNFQNKFWYRGVHFPRRKPKFFPCVYQVRDAYWFPSSANACCLLASCLAKDGVPSFTPWVILGGQSWMVLVYLLHFTYLKSF